MVCNVVVGRVERPKAVWQGSRSEAGSFGQ